jgi:hypothetical protein
MPTSPVYGEPEQIMNEHVSSDNASKGIVDERRKAKEKQQKVNIVNEFCFPF